MSKEHAYQCQDCGEQSFFNVREAYSSHRIRCTKCGSYWLKFHTTPPGAVEVKARLRRRRKNVCSAEEVEARRIDWLKTCKAKFDARRLKDGLAARVRSYQDGTQR